MSAPSLLVEVDAWGAATVYVVRGDERLRLSYFYSTMPSSKHRPAAERYAADVARLLGLDLPVEIKDQRDIGLAS